MQIHKSSPIHEVGVGFELDWYTIFKGKMNIFAKKYWIFFYFVYNEEGLAAFINL